MNTIFESFRKEIASGDVVARLRAGLIGEGAEIVTPFGKKRLVYADYTASGRALRQVETFVAENVLPFYANSHTDASFCGAATTDLREGARRIIAKETNAGADCSVIFTGSGATAAVNRLVSLCGISRFKEGVPTVFIGPYEHHSNILPWRESGVQIVEIDEAAEGGPDLEMLEQELVARRGNPLLIGSFSAASNVTGIISDVDAITGLLKRYGALAFWDYAGAGPYLDINMNPGDGFEKDAVFLSPHKFPGGPGASGLLIVRNSVVTTQKPTWPGGGSVSYVSPWGHDYVGSIAEREEAGTPNIIGDIRAALVMLVKSAIGVEFIARRDWELSKRALSVWQNNPRLRVLGVDKPNRLPIFSLIVSDGQNGSGARNGHSGSGGRVHHQLFTRMLSDVYGVQARGGCACAGPYGHRLLGVEQAQSEAIREMIRAGQEMEKPGWTRLNLNYLMDDATATHIINAVDGLARNAEKYTNYYRGSATSGKFSCTLETKTPAGNEILGVQNPKIMWPEPEPIE
jgi:selenocysteine lyase/cysteine desulfurase